MKTIEQCKNEIARVNNFDSFEKAIRYTFNRELLQSETEFINKIIGEAMEKYAQVRVENLTIPRVSVSVCSCGKNKSKYADMCIECMKIKDGV